jgi:hypothetical protein
LQVLDVVNTKTDIKCKYIAVTRPYWIQ